MRESQAGDLQILAYWSRALQRLSLLAILKFPYLVRPETGFEMCRERFGRQ